MRLSALVVLLALTAPGVSCVPDEALQLTVDLRTDLVAGREFDTVRTELLRALSDPAVVDIEASQELVASAGDDFVSGRRVAELGDVPAGDYRLRVRLERAGVPFLERIVRVSLVESFGITVSITRDCRGVSCPGPTDPPEHTACIAGTCVPPDCTTGNGEGCPMSECAADADCPPTVPCATPRCLEGVCYYFADDAACAETERCDLDAGCVDEMACTPHAELCDGLDDDCDGATDEDFDLTSDPLHCGVCGNACPAIPSGTTRCASGVCLTTCDSGLADCNGAQTDGCEATLGTAEHCASCEDACPADRPMCASDSDPPGCTNGCPAGSTLCGTSCANTLTDPRHCGACGNECLYPNGAGACSAGVCMLMRCNLGFADCDLEGSNGCETSTTTTESCGGCGLACARANATATCAGGACRIDTCNLGFANCDGLDANGCETPLGTIDNCLICGDRCALPHARSTCRRPTGCVVDSCDPGWNDCDRDPRNGCESSIMEICSGA